MKERPEYKLTFFELTRILLLQAVELHEERGKKYGEDTWKQTALLVLRIFGNKCDEELVHQVMICMKLARLRQMFMDEMYYPDETMSDTLTDAAVYINLYHAFLLQRKKQEEPDE